VYLLLLNYSNINVTAITSISSIICSYYTLIHGLSCSNSNEFEVKSYNFFLSPKVGVKQYCVHNKKNPAIATKKIIYFLTGVVFIYKRCTKCDGYPIYATNQYLNGSDTLMDLSHNIFT